MWLLSCSHNSNKNNVGPQLQIIGKTLDKLSTSYDDIILLGDVNVELKEAKMSEFLNIYILKNLVSRFFCFKNPNRSCIDLILTNCLRSFQNIVLKQYYPQQKLRWCYIESKNISEMIYLKVNLRISYLIMI